jgi:hypothetical protein
VVYFDAGSAAKTGWGSMGTQNVITSVITGPNMVDRDIKRIKALCEWGEGLGVDGFVRYFLAIPDIFFALNTPPSRMEMDL